MVTQSGGELAIDGAARVVNLAGASWIDADNGILSTSGTGVFVNFGLFEDAAATGVTAISGKFVSTGMLAVVAAGTLAFAALIYQTQLSGGLTGGGLVEYGSSNFATLGVLTVAATNQNNLGTVDLTGTQILVGAQTIKSLGQWNFDGDVSMLASAADSAAVQFTSFSGAVVAKTAGAGVSLVSASVSIAGQINVAAGTLEFADATSLFDGPISGAGTFEIGAGHAEF